MKKHNGMRPHDIAVLLKIISLGEQNWYMKDLASDLEISASEISESINRSSIAGLINEDKRTVDRVSFLEFLRSGFRFVFPQQPGRIVKGIVTARSAPPLNKQIFNEDKLVWAYKFGNEKGQEIEPLHPRIPEACLRDNKFYEMMSLIESLRLGSNREQRIAFEMLKVRILTGNY